ncbi:uncharacterized protein LOC132677018 isoform X4 [Panthera onca]
MFGMNMRNGCWKQSCSEQAYTMDRRVGCLVRSVDNFLSISQLRPLRSSYLPTVTDWAASCPCVPSCLAQNGGAPGLSAGPASRGRINFRRPNCDYCDSPSQK